MDALENGVSGNGEVVWENKKSIRVKEKRREEEARSHGIRMV